MGGGGTSLKEGEVLYTRYKSGNNVFSLSGVIFKETPTSNRFSIFFDECTEDKISFEVTSIDVQPLIVNVNAVKATDYSTLKPRFIQSGLSSYLKPELSTYVTNVFLLIGFLVDTNLSTLSFKTTVHTSPSTINFSDFSDAMPTIRGTAQTYRQDSYGNAVYDLEKKLYKGSMLLTKNKNSVHFMNPFEVYNADGTLKNFLFNDDGKPHFLKQTKNAKLVNAPILELNVRN